MNLHPLIRCSAVMTFVIATVALAESPDVAAALADRAHYSAEDQQHLFYLSTRPHAGEARRDLQRAIKLAVASNTKQQILERCVPVEVDDNLLRINIADLGWRAEDWAEVAGERNPYTTDPLPLVTRADWLLVQLSDQHESDTYLRLMFGGNNLPKTSDEIRAFFRVDNEPSLRFGLIEGESGVNVQGTRWIESRPISRGYYWHTEDALRLDKDRDPVEHPDGTAKHDGEEHIIGLPKFSTRHGKRGTLQWYWLANGKSEVVDRAPVDLVVDANRFRGFPEIRNPGSCIICHDNGLNPFKRNELRSLIESGVVPYAEGGKYEDIERFHMADQAKELARANEDFQMAVALTCGCTSGDAAKSFKAAVDRYDAPLNLEDVSREVGCSVEKLADTLKGTLPARLASLTKGNELLADGTRTKRGAIPRAAYEQYALGIERAAANGGAVELVEKVEVKPAVEKSPEPAKPAAKPVQKQSSQSNRGRR